MVQYKIDFVVDGRKVKEVTKQFDDQEKSVEKLSKTFSSMEKISLATAATQLKMIGNVKSLGTMLQTNMVTPILKLGAGFGELQKLTQRNVTTQQGITWLQTRMGNIMNNEILPATTALLAVQEQQTEETEETTRGLRGMLKSMKDIKKAAAAVAMVGIFALGAASPLLQARMSMLSFQFEQMSIIIGDALAPAVELLSGLLQILLDAYNNLDQPSKDFLAVLLLIIPAVLAYNLAIGAAGALTAAATIPFVAITVPIWALIAALGILVVAWGDIAGGIGEVWGGLMKIIDGDLVGGLGDIIGGIGRMTIGAMASVLEFAHDIATGITRIISEAIKDLFNITSRQQEYQFAVAMAGAEIGAKFWLPHKQKMKEMKIALASLEQEYADVTGWTPYTVYGDSKGFRGVGGTFHAGGIIPGVGGTVPIMAHPGEMVLNRRQQQNMFSMLNNGGDITNNNQRNAVFNINININGAGGDMGTETGEELRNAIIGRISSL